MFNKVAQWHELGEVETLYIEYNSSHFFIYLPNIIKIFALNVQNCIGFWGSAPDLAGGAYDAPPDPLVVKGFLPSAIAASRKNPPLVPKNKNSHPFTPPKHKIIEPLSWPTDPLNMAVHDSNEIVCVSYWA